MCSKTPISPSIESFSNELAQLKGELSACEAIVIGAGAGLSTSAGFTYSGERFERHFADFIEKFGFTDMYTGGFYDFASPEQHWAYWSRYIFINRYTDAPGSVYGDLKKLVQHKDYFVITTNVDHCFQKAGFDKSRLFYTQGDYGLFQCSKPCHKATWDNESAVRDMIRTQRDMRIPTELLPRCPVCGAPAMMNLRADDRFVEDAGWHAAARRYQDFLRRTDGKRVLFLELGVGYNTPGIIKYPFWQMTYRNANATYACINLGEAVIPGEIAYQSIGINADISEAIRQLL